MNFSDLGLQLTRTCRALKLWISIRYFGVAAFRAAIDTCLDLALHAQRRIAASPELELMTPASLGDRHVPPPPGRRRRRGVLERINAGLAEEIERQGDVFVSTGRVRGRLVLRLCILNHSTSQAEVDRALELAATLPVDARALRPGSVRESYPPIEQGWLRRPSLDRGRACARSPLFAVARRRRRPTRVLRRAREHHAVAGRGDRRAVAGQPRPLRRPRRRGRGHGGRADAGRTSGPGEFFGELAALDWGAGFARTRTATVTATRPTRLLVLDWVLVNRLMKADARVRRAARAGVARAPRATLSRRTSST